MNLRQMVTDIKKEFRSGLFKTLGWTIPISIASFLILLINNNIIFPEFHSDKYKVKELNDASVLSPDNPSPPGHLAGYFNASNEFVQPEAHGIPELEISFTGKGQIKSASLFYTYSEEKSGENTDKNTLLQQSVSLSNKLTGFYWSPYKLNTSVNIVKIKKDDYIPLYLGIVSKKESNKYVYLIMYNDKSNIKMYSEKDIEEILPFSQENEEISFKKEQIQKDISDIKNRL